MGKFNKLAIATVASASLFVGAANAATSTDTFTVTMTILASCTVVATPMAFVDTDVFADRTATSLVTATCAPGTVFDVGLNDGANESGGQRRMKNTLSADYLNYDLYTDAGLTTRWDDIAGTTTQGDDGSDLDGIVIYTVYGEVPSQSSPPAGAYTDTITVTVDF